MNGEANCQKLIEAHKECRLSVHSHPTTHDQPVFTHMRAPAHTHTHAHTLGHSIVMNGEANCQKLIEAHKECMRSHGFNI